MTTSQIVLLSLHASESVGLALHSGLIDSFAVSDNSQNDQNSCDSQRCLSCLQKTISNLKITIKSGDLRIKTKYYVADTQLKSFFLGQFIQPSIQYDEMIQSLLCDLAHILSIEGLIVLFDCSILLESLLKESIRNVNEMTCLQLILDVLKLSNPGVRLLLITNSTATNIARKDFFGLRSQLLDWCIDHQFELLFPFHLETSKTIALKPAFCRPLLEDYLNHDSPVSNSSIQLATDNRTTSEGLYLNDRFSQDLAEELDCCVSLDRVLEALACHQWPGLQRLTQVRQFDRLPDTFLHPTHKKVAGNEVSTACPLTGTSNSKVPKSMSIVTSDASSHAMKGDDILPQAKGYMGALNKIVTLDTPAVSNELICDPSALTTRKVSEWRESHAENEKEIDCFDGLLKKMQSVREMAKDISVSDHERRSAACSVAMEFIKYLQLDDHDARCDSC